MLVNNAGYGAGEAFLEMKAETWDRTLGLNVKALALAWRRPAASWCGRKPAASST